MAWHLALDLRLEVATGDVQRAGERALLVLVGLADVEQDRAGQAAHVVGGGGVDLADLGSWPWPTGRGSWTWGKPTCWVGIALRPRSADSGRDQASPVHGLVIKGSRSLIEPRSTTSASMSISVGSAFRMIT